MVNFQFRKKGFNDMVNYQFRKKKVLRIWLIINSEKKFSGYQFRK